MIEIGEGDVERGLAEIYRVLQSGGLIHIAGRPAHVIRAYPFANYGFRCFDKQEISEILINNGFNTSDIIEEKEPPREIDGRLYDIETLIVSGEKVD